MKVKIFLLIFLAVGLSLTAKTYRLKSSVIINTSSIYLSDIIDEHAMSEKEKAAFQQIKISDFNSSQKFVNLKSEWIESFLKEKQYEDIQLSGQLVSVYFKQKMIDEQQIKELILSFLSEKLTDYNDINIEFVKIPLIYIQEDLYDLSVNDIDLHENSANIILTINCSVMGKKTESYTAHVKLFKTYEVYQLKNSKKMSESYYISDLQKTIIKDLRNNKYQISLEDILNSVAQNYCPKGKIINASDLREQPLVRKDQMVKVNIISNSFQLSYEAIAKTNAWLGEQVTLQNPENKKFFNARVIAKNTVEINLEEK